jgi:hypothetical protein
MADYYKNSDKVCESHLGGLYNTVLKVVFSAEGSEPVTVEEAKSWGKIEQDYDDDLIEELITAAREDLEGFTGLGFITRSLVVGINNADGGFNLPYGPIITGPDATDTDGNTLDLTFNLGQIEEPRGRMTVTYTGGYATLPKKFKTALKQQILFLYENRGESSIGLSPIAESLLRRYRVVV